MLAYIPAPWILWDTSSVLGNVAGTDPTTVADTPEISPGVSFGWLFYVVFCG